MKYLIVTLLVLTICSCSSGKPDTGIQNSTTNETTSIESSSIDESIPTSDPNDVGGDNLQTDWDW